MKNENVHTQALHRKLDVVLVQILPYNCSETDYSFCEDSPPAGLHPLPRFGFHPQTLLAPTIFVRSAAPDVTHFDFLVPIKYLRFKKTGSMSQILA